MKYVIYLRVSTIEQDNRTQLQKCLRFLDPENKNEINYIVFTDKITSKRALHRRPGLQEALSALNKGDVLVGQKIDRLARNSYETHQIIHQLEKKGAEVIMVDQPGIKNKILLGLYAGIAEEEVIMIRARIKDKMDAKGERNERKGTLPYGYTLDQENLVWVNGPERKKILKPGYLIPEPREQEILQQMIAWRREGKTYRQITQCLSDHGLRNRKGESFQLKSVHRILSRQEESGLLDQALQPIESHRDYAHVSRS